MEKKFKKRVNYPLKKKQKTFKNEKELLRG